jgi:diguanylate cyclase (GGDEF)-like protein
MRDQGTAEAGSVSRRGQVLRRRLRVRSLLLLVVLAPTLGMLVIAGTSASATLDQRRAASDMQDQAADLAALVDARAAVAHEATGTAVVTVAAGLGAGIDQLSELYGIDYAEELAAARAVVDADPTLRSLPELEDDLDRLRALRDQVDAEAATFEDSQAVFDELVATFDGVWRDRFERLDDDDITASLPGLVHARLDALAHSFDALAWGDRRAQLTIRLLLLETDPGQITELIGAQSRYDTALERLSTAGPLATDALAALDDPAGRRFNASLRDAARDLVAGEPSPLATDPAAFGEAFVDGPPWSARLVDLVQAAAGDLRDQAATQSDAASRDLLAQVGTATALTVVALAGALMLAQSVTRQVRRLEGAAQQIHAGHFDLEPIVADGPRELADTASAFNEMAFTLAAVEAHAVALADDPEAPVLSRELPGRTGRALQVALNRLRGSIRRADQQRRELEELATQDGLTGLMNRNAAFAMIEHDLSRAVREERVMMALFIDLDGLKGINDAHGHAAGDDALRLTADALRATTRLSDVVARIGGDEFLVAGMVLDGPAEAKQLAERIRQAVAGQELVCPGGRVPLHCSIGVALTGEPRESVDSVDSLVRRADAALYAAKRAGRNRVALHDDPAPRGP